MVLKVNPVSRVFQSTAERSVVRVKREAPTLARDMLLLPGLTRFEIGLTLDDDSSSD